jgi:uncharacterized RDD family membrane protein YckC
MRYVGVGRRAVAILIDSVILGAGLSTLADRGGFEITHPTGPGSFNLSWNLSRVGAQGWAVTVIWLVYMTLLEGMWGASLGKFALGIRVVKTDGSPPDLVAAFLRNLLRLIDALFFYLVGAIFVWSSPFKQRLGDRVAGTVVVPARVAAHNRSNPSLAPTSAPPPPIPPRPD